MRKYVVAIACVIAFFMDSILFGTVGIYNLRPDALCALFVSLGLLIGSMPAAAIGIPVGLLLDVLLNKYVGLSSLSFLGAALAGGIFHNKFYADNIVIPSVTAAIVAFVKEHVMLIAVALSGGRIGSYMLTLAAHILPAALLTGGLCALFHLVLKRTLFDPRHRKDIDER